MRLRAYTHTKMQINTSVYFPNFEWVFKNKFRSTIFTNI